MLSGGTNDERNVKTFFGGAGTDTLSINDANANIDLTADILKLQNVSGVEVIGFTGLDGGDTVTINDGVVSTAGGALTLKFLTGVAGSNTINASGVLASVSTVSFTDLAGLATTYSIGNGKDNVAMGDSGDTIVVSNAAYLSGTDTLDAGTGADTLSFTNDTAATNTITGAQLAGVKGAETFNINHATDTNLVNYVFTLDDTLVGNQVSVGSTFTISRDAAEDGTLKVDGSAVTNNYVLSLAGEDGNDTLLGGGGNDTISGMDGNDSLTGGGGNDVFVVTGLTQAANGSDTVTDFNFGTALTSVDRVQVDVTSTTAVFGRASTGITAAAGTEILILDMAAYQDAAGAETAAQTAFGANDNAAEALVIWQDTLGNLNLSVYADSSADATANGTLQTSMVRFSGLTLSGVGSLINSGDFLLV
jgi:Ca2+-binding RTX toxin-like protein